MAVNALDTNASVIVNDKDSTNISCNGVEQDKPNSVWESKDFWKNVGYGTYFGLTPGAIFATINALSLGEKAGNPDANVFKCIKELKKQGVKVNEISKLVKPIKLGVLFGVTGALLGGLTGYLIYKNKQE